MDNAYLLASNVVMFNGKSLQQMLDNVNVA